MPPLYSNTNGSRQCLACNAGLYAVFHDALTGDFDQCSPCPQGADCPALQDMLVSPRYYAVRNATTRAVVTYVCDGDRCLANGQCGPRRLPADENPLCGRCQAGDSEWGGSCVTCGDGSGGLILAAVLAAWVCVMVIHGLSQSTLGSSALRIALYMWQVALLVAGRATWLRWAAFLDLDFLTATGGSACPFPASPLGVLLAQLLAPLILFALLGATAAVHAAFLHFRQQSPAAGDDALPDDAESLAASRSSSRTDRVLRVLSIDPSRFVVAAYARTSISLYFFTFNQVTRRALAFFSCVSIDGAANATLAGSYLTSLPAVRCDSDGYRAVKPLAVLLLAAFLVLVPGYIAFKLWSFHRGGKLRDFEVQSWWGLVYAPFREDVYWWGLLQMIFRAALVAVAVFLYADDVQRLALMTLLSCAIEVLHALLLPNRSHTDNIWEAVSLAALTTLCVLVSMGAADALMATLTIGVALLLSARPARRPLRNLLRRWKVLGDNAARPTAAGGRSGVELVTDFDARSVDGAAAGEDAPADAYRALDDS